MLVVLILKYTHSDRQSQETMSKIFAFLNTVTLSVKNFHFLHERPLSLDSVGEEYAPLRSETLSYKPEHPLI